MDDLKQQVRETRDDAKKTIRRMDGDEDLADKAGNLGDDVRRGIDNLADKAGDLGDDVRRGIDDLGDDVRHAEDNVNERV